VVPTLNFFNEMVGYLNAKGIKEWIDNPSENLEINYAKHPLSSVAELEKVMTKANSVLGKVKDPILVLQGDADPVVNPSSATSIYTQVGSKVKKLVFVPRANHIIINSEGEEEVFESIYRFIGDIT
jgi:esterase/lipase